MRSAKTGLARRWVRRLPDPIEDAQPDPAPESTMNGGTVGEIFGQPRPLTAASQPKGYRVKDGTLVRPRAPGPVR